MKEQGFGQIYNVEGYGSNDAMMTGLTLYGTSKRAVTYFTRSLAKESRDLTGGRILVCRLTPGIMITDFLHTANGGSTAMPASTNVNRTSNAISRRYFRAKLKTRLILRSMCRKQTGILSEALR